MRILVVEDEVKTARLLKQGLGEAGFVVDAVGDGREAIHLPREVVFDLIVLDVMLPTPTGGRL